MRALTLSLAAVLLGACLPERDLTGVSCEPATGCEAPWSCVESAGRFVCSRQELPADGGFDAGGLDGGGVDAGGPDAGGSDAGSDAGLDGGVDAGVRDGGVVARASGERLLVVDLEGDGGFDLLFSDSVSPRISFWRAPQSFPALAEEFTITLFGGGIREVVPLNLTGGAALELLVFPIGSGAPVLLTRAGGTWAESTWAPLTDPVVAAGVVDVEGDGRPELVLAKRGSTLSLDLYRVLGDGGVSSWSHLVTYSATAEVRGVRHAAVPGGTLVVDFGSLGFRSRLVDAAGAPSRLVNHSEELLELHRIVTTDPRRLFMSIPANGGAPNHYTLAPDASVDVAMMMQGSDPNGLVVVDAGTTDSRCMGDFRATAGALTPALVVAGATVVAYPYLQRVNTGSFPGDRWVQAPQPVTAGPVVGATLAAPTVGAPVDLFLVGEGTPRSLLRVAGH